MKIKTHKTSLSDALSRVSRFTPAKTTMPILSHILITASDDATTLSATDLSKGAVVTCNARVEDPGSVAVPSRRLSDFVNTLPDDVVTLRLKDYKLHLSCGKTKAQFPAMPAEEFPVMASPSDVANSIDTVALSAALDHVLFCASTDMSHPVLGGAYLDFAHDGFWVSAADGFRMARTFVAGGEWGDRASVIIPADALSLVHVLSPDGTLYLGNKENGIGFTLWDGESHIEGALLDGSYPDVERIIPASCETKVVVRKDLLATAAKRAMIFSRDVANIIVFDVSQGQIVISGDGGEASGVTEVPADVTGKDVKIAFNGRFIADAVKAVATGEVSIEMNQPTTPAAFREVGGDDNWTHVLMPMHIKG